MKSLPSVSWYTDCGWSRFRNDCRRKKAAKIDPCSIEFQPYAGIDLLFPTGTSFRASSSRPQSESASA